MSITQRGVNTYLVRVYMGRDPLTKKRISINETVLGTLASAKKLEAKLKGQKVEGRITKPARMSLDTMLDLYLDFVRHSQAETTQNKNRRFLDKYVRPHVGSLPIGNITSRVLQDLFNIFMDKKEVSDEGSRKQMRRGGGLGLAPNTVKIIRKLLAAAFNYAIRQKLVAENPVHGTRLPPVTGTRAASLTFDEAEALVSVKDQFWFGDAFVFQLHTGLRPQELMALVWEDVDFERGTLRVERACKWINGAFTGFGSTKTMRGVRTIELAPQHLDLLRAHRRKQQEAAEARKTGGASYGEPLIKEWAAWARSGRAHLYDSAELIFPRRDGRVPHSLMPRLEFKEVLRRANVGAGQPTYRWHDLRHTHASFLIKLDVPLTEVAARMGHSLAELVRTYAHEIQGKRSDAPDLFAKVVPVQGDKLDALAEKDLGADAGGDDSEPRAGGSDCQ